MKLTIFFLSALLAGSLYFGYSNSKKAEQFNRDYYQLLQVNTEYKGDIIDLTEESLRLEKELHATNFCISHLPKWGGGFGGPWTVEKYWRQEQLWVALKDYHTREAAEDVKAQLQSGQLKTRDLFR